MTKTAIHCDNGRRLDTIEREHTITRKTAHDATNAVMGVTMGMGLIKKDIESLTKYDQSADIKMNEITKKLDKISESQTRAQTTIGIYAIVLGALLTISISVIGWLVLQVVDIKTDVVVIKERLSSYNITVE